MDQRAGDVEAKADRPKDDEDNTDDSEHKEGGFKTASQPGLATRVNDSTKSARMKAKPAMDAIPISMI